MGGFAAHYPPSQLGQSPCRLAVTAEIPGRDGGSVAPGPELAMSPPTHEAQRAVSVSGTGMFRGITLRGWR